MQAKFHVNLSHSFREKCDDKLKLASHFSQILCDRGTKFHVPRSHSFRQKCDDKLQNWNLHNCPNKQLRNFTR